jgi:ankyrin repeat protein
MNGRSLLHYAADAGNFDVLKELVSHGANVNVNNLFERISFYYLTIFII